MVESQLHVVQTVTEKVRSGYPYIARLLPRESDVDSFHIHTDYSLGTIARIMKEHASLTRQHTPTRETLHTKDIHLLSFEGEHLRVLHVTPMVEYGGTYDPDPAEVVPGGRIERLVDALCRVHGVGMILFINRYQLRFQGRKEVDELNVRLVKWPCKD